MPWPSIISAGTQFCYLQYLKFMNEKIPYYVQLAGVNSTFF